MEDTLRAKVHIKNQQHQQRLNPCFNGRYSQSSLIDEKDKAKKGLNPCFNGRYSQRRNLVHYQMQSKSLNPCFNGRYSQRARHTNPLYKLDWYL